MEHITRISERYNSLSHNSILKNIKEHYLLSCTTRNWISCHSSEILSIHCAPSVHDLTLHLIIIITSFEYSFFFSFFSLLVLNLLLSFYIFLFYLNQVEILFYINRPTSYWCTCCFFFLSNRFHAITTCIIFVDVSKNLLGVGTTFRSLAFTCQLMLHVMLWYI